MNRYFSQTLYGSLLFFITLAPVHANFQYEAGVNAIHQSTDANIPASNTLTADFAFRYLQPNYELNLSLVTASKIATDSFANAIQYASPHPGIDGNLHVSQLFTNIKLSESSNVFMGIMDGSGWLDTSLISNDDTQNFITPDFINNLTIDFPDYTPGIGLITQLNDSVMSTFYLSTARELDISQAKVHEYNEQEGVEEEDTDDRGVFAATETAWVIDNGFISLGAWLRSGDYVNLRNEQDNRLNNYGIYSVLSRTYGNTSLESRLGWANPKVSEVAQFYALNVEHKTHNLLAKSRIGAGISRRISGELPNNSPLKNTSSLEVYFAIPITKNFTVTPFIQSFQPAIQVEGSPFDQSNLWAVGLRMRLFTINEI